MRDIFITFIVVIVQTQQIVHIKHVQFFVYQLYLNKSVKIFLMDPHIKFSSTLLAFPSSFLYVTDLSEIKEVGKPWHAKHDQCSMVYLKFLDTFHKAQKYLYFLIYFIRRALIQVSSV